MTAEEVWREARKAYNNCPFADFDAPDQAAVSVIRTAMEAYAAEKVAEPLAWREMESAPRDTEILLLLGDTFPDHTDARVGKFIDADGAKDLGEGDADCWMIVDSHGENWWCVDLDQPFGWLPILSLPQHIGPSVMKRVEIEAASIRAMQAANQHHGGNDADT